MAELRLVPDPDELSVEERLAELGLALEPLQRGALAGLTARASRTSAAPKNAPGTDLYSHTVEELRLQLLPDGWFTECVRGQERTVSPDLKTAIVVSTGDGPVGMNGNPKTAHPKGPLMRNAVESNQQFIQESIPGLVVPAGDQSDLDTTSCLVWILLLKVEVNELSMELSLPDRFGDDGRVESWAQRILLPPIPLGSLVESTSYEGPVFDVPVERR